jgi:undecaprenyl diphosphate synthase
VIAAPSNLHVAIIMDGNGRWAAERGLPRVAGHRAGADTVRRITEAAPGLGIGVLTLYAFSEDNWSRPRAEVAALFGLLDRYLASETTRCIEQGVRLEAIGRRDRMPDSLVNAIETAERATHSGTNLRLRLALDYSSRTALVDAVAKGAVTRDSLSAALGPDVDLLIRTSGEQRLSDFLLWECAYAEFLFTPRQWPDFSRDDLAQAIADFRRRDRRFGALPALRTA